MKPPPPETEEELRLRARRLAGWTLSDLAGHLGERAPLDLRRAKGWAGEALERALGATSGSQPEPDFPHLGIELKSIPVGHDGLPRESTYVSAVPLVGHAGLHWEGSLVRRKLCRVLFVPVEGAPDGVTSNGNLRQGHNLDPRRHADRSGGICSTDAHRAIRRMNRFGRQP